MGTTPELATNLLKIAKRYKNAHVFFMESR